MLLLKFYFNSVPVSCPILTLRVPGAQAVVGDMVRLCEAFLQSCTNVITKNVTLGNISTPSGGGVSANISLTAEHSRNFFCEADNGLRAPAQKESDFFFIQSLVNFICSSQRGKNIYFNTQSSRWLIRKVLLKDR